jgi:hypothetical protein
VVELASFDGLRVLKVEVTEGRGEPVHLTQQRDHYKELRGDMRSCCFPSLALVLGVDVLDTVDEERGLPLIRGCNLIAVSRTCMGSEGRH